MSRKFQLILATIALVVVAACSSVSTSPVTFNEKLAIGYSTVTQIRVTATQLLKAGKIHAEDAQNVNNQADNARAGLDIAKSLSGKDLSGAMSKLQAVETVISSLSIYLSTREK